MKTFKAIFTNVLLAVLVGFAMSATAATQGISIDPMAASGAVFGVSFTVQTLAWGLSAVGASSFTGGLSLMAYQVEIWQDQLVENLFKYGNEFAQFAVSADEYVLDGTVVYIPQAGSTPAVTKNRNSWPITVTRRNDDKVLYALDDFSTDGTHIPQIEKWENSVDKVSSVLRDHFGTLMDQAMDELLYKWSTSLSANIVRTTGTAVSTNLAPSATGSRKMLLKEDIVKLAKILKKSKIKGQMYASVPTDMMSELLEDEDFVLTSNKHIESIANMAEGTVGKYAGVILIERTSTTIYDNALAPKAPDAVGATTDHQAVIGWKAEAVERAKGTIQFFETLGDATYQGDIYSALIKVGGRIRRNAGDGVAAIVQSA
jgi:hypothetical protein